MSPIRSCRRPALLCLMIGMASATAIAATAPPDAEEREEARQQLVADAQRVDDLLAQTRRGKNLSDMTLGLFAVHLLNEMSGDDAEMFNYLHRDHRTTQSYLEEIFQFHSAEEVAAVAAMAGDDPRRLTVRYALESLRHIPDGKESPDSQERDRMDMAKVLAQLEAAIKSVIADSAKR